MATIAVRPPGRARRRTGIALLVLPVVGLTCVPLYARDGPRLVDVPFFYWYQLVWVGLSLVCMAVAALLIPTTPTTPTTPTDPHRTTDDGGPQ